MSFRELCADAELWVGELRPFVVEGVGVILARTDHGIFAYRDRCPHLGVRLSRGTLDGSTLTCAAHHFQFDVRTGRGINPKDTALHAYPVRAANGVLYVDVEARLEVDAGVPREDECERRA